jgi:hypothetical protein
LPLLAPNSKIPFAPVIRVDEFWHEVILNTPSYRRFCESIYGGYLDHVPNQEELRQTFSSRAAEMAEFTNSLLLTYYGPLDQAVWGSELMRPCYPPPPPAIAEEI